MTPGWLDDPHELCTFLRSRGLRIGTGEALRVGAVLDRLSQRGKMPGTAAEATLWVSPLVCTNAAQQMLVPGLLAEFASLRAPIEPLPEPRPQPIHSKPPESNWFEQAMKRPMAVGAVALFAIAMVLIVIVFGENPGPPTQPSGTVDVAPSDFFSLLDWPRFLVAWPFAVLPLCAWLVFHRWYGWRPAVLKRARSREKPQEKKALADDPASQVGLFGALDLRQPLQAMRAHRLAPSLNYDFKQSARATAAAGGFLTLIQEMRPTLPEYPIIIEQLSGKDHVAALGRAFADRLTAERVAATVYTFSTDPRVLRGDPRRLLGLGDLLSRHGDETIILVSDGDVLIDPLTGAVNPAVAELVAWTNPIMLTPIPMRRWSRREQTLAEAGFLVLPATPAGIEHLSQKLAGNVELQNPALRLRAARPTIIGREMRGTLSWHQDEPAPSPEEREEIVGAVAAELPAAAFDLLCVLARFPEVRLDLTLHMGLQLTRRDGTPLLDEESFGALSWLPWMRLGRLPDWLRVDLVNCLSPKLRNKAGELYEAWLAPAVPGKGGQILELGREPNAFMRILRQHVKTDPTTPLRDVIFLKTQRGETVSDLDLRAPDELRRLLRPSWREPEWIVGGAAIMLAVMAVIYAPILVKIRGTFSISDIPFITTVFVAPPLSIITWHAAAYSERWRNWLSFATVVPLIVLLVVQAIFLSPVASDLAPYVIAVLSALPALALIMIPPTAGSLEQPQPERHVPFSVYVLLAALHIAILSGVPDVEPLQGFVAAGCGVLVVALLMARTLGLPYLPVAAGALCGAVGVVYWIAAAVSVVEGIFQVRSGSILVTVPQTGLISTLYGGLVAAAVLKRIRLTRFLIIATLGIAATLAIGIITLVTLSGVVIFERYLPAAITSLPICGLCLVLIQIALVRPDSFVSLRLLRGCILFAVGVTAMDVLAHTITIPMPILRWSGSLVSRPEIVVASATLGSAAQYLFVPGAVAAILADLAKTDVEKDEGRSTALSPWLSMLRVYRPPQWLVAVPLFWLLSIKFPLINGSSLAAPLLFIPFAAALAAFYGSASLPALLLGGLPLLVAMPLGPLQTIGNPAILLAGVLVHRLVADPQFRAHCFFATSIGTMQLIALIVLLGSTYQLSLDFTDDTATVVGETIVVGGTLQLALDYLLFVIGASRIAIRPVVYTVAAVGFVGIVSSLFAPFVSPALSLRFGPAAVQQVTTAVGFLLLGRLFFHRQLPSLLQSPEVPVRFIPSQTPEITNLMSGILLLSFASHMEIRYGLPGGRVATDGLIDSAILQPVIFMLGLSLGPRALIYAVAGVTLGEILPSFVTPFLGLEPVSLLSGSLKLGLSFASPLTLALSRLGDLAFGLVGWRVMAAFRPHVRPSQAPAASQSETPTPVAA